MLYLLKFLLLFSLIRYKDCMTFARRTLSRPVSSPSIIAASTFSTASSSMHSNNNSSASASRILNDNHTNAIAGVTTTLPIPVYPNPMYAGDYKATTAYEDIKSGNCPIKELYCSSKGNNGTVGKLNATSIDHPCLLWDPFCSGNRTLAIDAFFNLTFQQDLLGNRCFVLAGSVDLANTSKCDRHNPAGRMSEFQEIKNWMRSQQCVSAWEQWTAKDILDPDSREAILLDPDQYHISSGANPSCCGTCETNVENVDIYYWPEPDANTTCLSIIGDSVRPIGFGATRTVWPDGNTTTTKTYWGCKTKPLTYYDTLNSESIIYSDPISTAAITTIGSLSVKVYLSDPWSPSPCTKSDVMFKGSNRSAKIRDRHTTMRARGHTLTNPSSIALKDSLPGTTMVSGNFTFTSPSIYANFHGIKATDQCGGVVISSTMVAFAPGELATIAGPLANGIGEAPSAWRTKSFNFKDLPCPPQSVMEENWYKPQPGEPYRPLIALPSKLKEIIPWLSHCEDELFTAYDPPRALNPGAALAAPSSYNDPPAHSWAPVPIPTLNTGARQTVGAEASVPVPANVPTLDQPKATVTAVSAPTEQKGPDPGRQSNDPTIQENPPSQPRPLTLATNSDPKGGNDPRQGSDPKLDNNLNQINKNQGNNQNADQVPQDDPKQANKADPFEIYTEDRAKTINSLVVQPLSYGISVAGTILTPGASPITVSDAPIHHGPSALVVGISSVPLAPTFLTRTMTTIASQAIIAALNAAIVAGTTLRPDAPVITLAGTLISLNTASQLIIGSKTRAPESASQDLIVTEIGVQVITAAPNEVSTAGTALTLGASNTFVGKTLISLNKAGQSIVGSKTIAFQSGRSGVGGLIIAGLGVGEPSIVADQLVTTIDGQIITPESIALVIAGATLAPGDPGLTINGLGVPLNAAAGLVVGSKTILLEESASSSGQTAGLGGLTTGVPTSTQDNSLTRAENSTSAGAYISRGNTATISGSSLWRYTTVIVVLVSLLAYIR